MVVIKGILGIIKFFLIMGKYIFLSQSKNCNHTRLKERWSGEIINHFKLKIYVMGTPIDEDVPCLFVGNHISYLDIPVLISSFPGVTFVSKKAVKLWPIIGTAAVRMNTIFVERSSHNSRNSTKTEIKHSLKVKRQKIAIFPSGTTSLLNSQSWKKGVFEIAQDEDIFIQPFRVRYDPLRASAFIDDDSILTHMYSLLKTPYVKVFLEFHPPIKISSAIIDCEFWKNWCEEVLPPIRNEDFRSYI